LIFAGCVLLLIGNLKKEFIMKTKMLLIVLSMLAISAGAVGIFASDHSHDGFAPVESHSGGTNSDGCHTNHKTGNYHCHKRK
jgi:hypothetical protein